MSGPVEIGVIVLVVGFMVVRRLIGEPADPRRMLLLPAILSLVGLSDIAEVVQSALSVSFLVGTAAISVVLGILRGASIRVAERGGIVVMRYTATTVVLLVTNVAIKIGSGLLLDAIDPRAEHAVSSGLALTFGVGMLAEGLTVLRKAFRIGGRLAWGSTGGAPWPGGLSSSSEGSASTGQDDPDTRWIRSRGGRRGPLSGLVDDLRDLGSPPPDGSGPRDQDGPPAR